MSNSTELEIYAYMRHLLHRDDQSCKLRHLNEQKLIKLKIYKPLWRGPIPNLRSGGAEETDAGNLLHGLPEVKRPRYNLSQPRVY